MDTLIDVLPSALRGRAQCVLLYRRALAGYQRGHMAAASVHGTPRTSSARLSSLSLFRMLVGGLIVGHPRRFAARPVLSDDVEDS